MKALDDNEEDPRGGAFLLMISEQFCGSKSMSASFRIGGCNQLGLHLYCACCLGSEKPADRYLYVDCEDA
jgi:hypothetical protein